MSLLGSVFMGALGGAGKAAVAVGERQQESNLKKEEMQTENDLLAKREQALERLRHTNRIAEDNNTHNNNLAENTQTHEHRVTELNTEHGLLGDRERAARDGAWRTGYNPESGQWEEYQIVDGQKVWGGVRVKNPELTTKAPGRQYLDPRLEVKVKGIQEQIKTIQESDSLTTEEKQAQIKVLSGQIDVLLGYGLPEKKTEKNPPPGGNDDPPPPKELTPWERRAKNVTEHSPEFREMSNNPPLPTDRSTHKNMTRDQAILETTRLIELELGVPFNPQDFRQAQFLRANYPELWEAVTKP